jgi:hypothetical protein
VRPKCPCQNLIRGRRGGGEEERTEEREREKEVVKRGRRGREGQ